VLCRVSSGVAKACPAPCQASVCVCVCVCVRARVQGTSEGCVSQGESCLLQRSGAQDERRAVASWRASQHFVAPSV
jgi:hypothetical protein